MAYTVNGLLNGENVFIEWNNGVVTTSFVVRRYLEAQAKIGIDVPGVALDGANWSDPLAFLFLVRQSLDEITATQGDVPMLAKVLEGDAA